LSIGVEKCGLRCGELSRFFDGLSLGIHFRANSDHKPREQRDKQLCPKEGIKSREIGVLACFFWTLRIGASCFCLSCPPLGSVPVLSVPVYSPPIEPCWVLISALESVLFHVSRPSFSWIGKNSNSSLSTTMLGNAQHRSSAE
jgi:hypothetical protein